MKISEIITRLALSTVVPVEADKDITTAYTADLLSDVMGNAPDEGLLITIQAHKNTLAVATLKDFPAIIICNNRPIPNDMIEAAKSEKIGILVSAENQFTISGKLFAFLHTDT